MDTALYNLTMTASSQQLSTGIQLLTVKEVAEMLGVTSSSVYRMVDKRVIASYRIRSGLRFQLQDVVEYLNSCRREAIRHEHAYGQKD